MTSISELEKDLSELETLLQSAQQTRTKNLISKEISVVKAQIENVYSL